MQALFIGQTYIDVTFLADHMPQGDEKSVASEYAVSFGGNAVTAAFCCAKLGIKPDLIATIADDWLGNMFLDMAAKYDIRSAHPQGREIVAVVHHAEGRQARHRALPRRPLPDAVSRARPRRLPRAASRRSSARCGAGLRATLPQGRHPDLARRRRPAHQHPRAARLHRCRDGGGTVLPADGQDAARRCSTISRAAAARSAASRRASAACSGTTRAARCARFRRCRCRQTRVRDTSGAGDVFHGAYVYSYLEQPVQRLGASTCGSPSTPRPTRSSISATKPACRRSTRSRRSPASSIRIADACRAAAGARKRRGDVGAAADRTQAPPARSASAAASSDARSTVPGTLTWSSIPSTSSIAIETSRVGVAARKAATSSKLMLLTAGRRSERAQ